MAALNVPARPDRAVILVGHGTISDPHDVPEFLRRIRRGRPAAPAFIEEIQRRYRLIGESPLLTTTQSLARALEVRLGCPVRVAMRFWAPLVDDVVAQLVAEEVREVCILPVAPFSVHVYAGVVQEAVAALAGGAHVPRLCTVEPYGEDPALLRAQVAKIAPLLVGRRAEDTELFLTAHSLPLNVLKAGDPYQRLFEASASAIASALGWKVRVVYQSQGEGMGEWLGPTLDEALTEAASRGRRGVVVAPVGFLADHIETLYDLDVEAAARARSLGLGFARAPALGDDPALADALSDVVRRAFA
jgi:ferrochelatase